jgi:hypothetical protein
MGWHRGHALVDIAEGESRGIADDAASGVFWYPFSFEFKQLVYQAVSRTRDESPT